MEQQAGILGKVVTVLVVDDGGIKDWLMQVAQLSGCCVLPIIAEDGFRFPSPSYYEDWSTASDSYTEINKSSFLQPCSVQIPDVNVYRY